MEYMFSVWLGPKHCSTQTKHVTYIKLKPKQAKHIAHTFTKERLKLRSWNPSVDSAAVDGLSSSLASSCPLGPRERHGPLLQRFIGRLIEDHFSRPSLVLTQPTEKE
ncbi:hypothetical protein EUGRSUZ_K00362 [Eucalyptus grandis]|uniref:Uncharacterized protein n=2 Tax=Eucalyptus grandis TaxID=71139 RepID=A0ACC3IQ76_EUCGR|nr:hypothetical protein EUGRSUZ_K00362 [Eucalyptus grandis]